MTRGRFFAIAMPIWAVIYVSGVVVTQNSTFAVIGAMVFALIAIVGSTVIRSGPNQGRQRDRSDRAKRRAGL